MVFYGDSITKLWKDGTPSANGMSSVFASYFGKHSAAVAGVGGQKGTPLLHAVCDTWIIS